MKDNNTRSAEELFPSGHQPPSDYERPAKHARIVCDKDIAVPMRDGVNVVVDVVLLPHHGTYIASIASTAAYAIVLILHLRRFAGELGSWGALRPTLSGTTSLVRVALRRS